MAIDKDYSYKNQNPGLVKQASSLLLDCIPDVGTVKSFIELIRGRDIVTGQPVSRWLSAGGVILGLLPCGRLLEKGGKAAQISEEVSSDIATRIAYGAKTKKELLKKIEDIETDPYLVQKIDAEAKSSPLNLKKVNYSSDPKLAGKYARQEQAAGHATYKHWVLGDRRKLLGKLSPSEKAAIDGNKEEADQLFDYIQMILKDPDTEVIALKDGRIGFRNQAKKVIMIDNLTPNEEGTLFYHKNPKAYKFDK